MIRVPLLFSRSSTRTPRALNARPRSSAARVPSRRVLGKRERLTGPKVDHLRIARFSSRSTKRRGQVVDVRISGRSLKVVVTKKTIDDAARTAAGEGPRDSGSARALERLTVWRARPSLAAAEKGGTDLSGTRTRR